MSYVPESHIRVKIYDHSNLSRASVVQFRASRYILSPNRTFVWKLMTIRISWELPLFNFERVDEFCPRIAHSCERLWPFKFVERSVVQFRASRYITSPNRTSVWKLTTIRISWELPLFNFERLDILFPRIEHPSEMLWPFAFLESFRCLILSVSIYYVPESNIWVKCYDHLNFSRTSIFQLRASRYIMGLNSTRMSKVMAVWIGPELWCSVSSVYIYYVPESNIRVKSSDLLDFSRTSIFQLRATRYIMGLNCTPMSKVMAIWIGPEFPCSVSSVSIYYMPESDIRVKCMTIWISQELQFFNYERLNISWASIVNPCQKLGLFEFLNWTNVWILSISVYHGSQSYTHGHNFSSRYFLRTLIFEFLRTSIFEFLNFERLDILCAWI